MTFPDLPCPHCGELVRLVNQPAFADPSTAIDVATPDARLAGPDGEVIADLLAVPKAFAMGAIVEASLIATERSLAARQVDTRFWNPADLGDVAASLAGLMGYSDLVGRARIRLYQRAARGETRAFASPRKGFVNVTPDWSILTPLRNIARAILENLQTLANFFADIFHAVDFVPAGWAEFYRDLGFRRAVETEAIVREKLQGKFDTLPVQELPTAEDILNEIGVGPANPSYPTVVVDINSHERLNVGGQEEQAKPDVAADLPAWRYEAVPRPTSRPHHLARRGNIYPASTPFEVIRGTDISQTANCLCSWVPLSGAGASSGAMDG